MYCLRRILAGCTGLLLSMGATAARADVVHWTLIHTNDLHSHLKGEKDELGLGGVARIKTAADRIRAEGRPTVMVDGGDWSEGQVYYDLSLGTDTLNVMGAMGYDVAVVGNHDFYNGPDTLLGAVAGATHRPDLVGDNLDLSGYAKAEQFRKLIPSYVIKNVGGLKVAFMGVITYEKMYDHFFEPVLIKEPFLPARRLAASLKKDQGVDIVVAISHNGVGMNKQLLKWAPAVDFVVGAHDHVALTDAVIVGGDRGRDNPGWIVEAGCWGRFLGRVDMTFDRSTHKLKLDSYRLKPMDNRVPEDPVIAALVADLDRRIVERFGDIYQTQVAESDVYLHRDGPEAPMGNVAADALRDYTGAELALENTAFVYNPIFPGQVMQSDVMNSMPAIFNPATQKTWTVFTLPIRGSTLKKLLKLLLSTDMLASMGIVNGSGIEVVYEPMFRRDAAPWDSFLSGPTASERDILHSVKVGGTELTDDRVVNLAGGGGVLESIKFVNRVLPGTVPLDQLKDTGVESWRALGKYLADHSPITEVRSVESAPAARFQPWQADPSVTVNDISWTPSAVTATQTDAGVRVRVRNLGAQDVGAGQFDIELLSTASLTDIGVTPMYQSISAAQALPAIPAQHYVEVSWNGIKIPGERGLYPVTVVLRPHQGAPNASNANDLVTRWFRPVQ
ncbi:MAG TPA: metallophosphoesterase [Bdellovibrionota bacterium]|nr:metallophosphoesterase [Bdellovibrionota bacterium]